MPEPELPAPYLTPDDIREQVPLVADDRIDDDLLTGLIAEFEELAENYRGVAFTPRERTVTLPISLWTGRVLLPDMLVTEITEASVDGTTLTEEELALLVFDDNTGLLNGFASRFSTAVLTYTHGYATVPPAVLRACREFVRAKAIEAVGNAPRNAIAYSDDSGFSYRDSTADWNAGRPTGLRTVDDALNTVPDHRVPALA